jgi:hypothetical protein
MAKSYKIREGSLHEQFQNSRAKIQMFAGGFGNGKTTAAVIKGIQLARDYPGSNGLIARSTYPKLSATIRKETSKWIPRSWVVRDVDSKNNLIELKNGSIINFSHVQQTGKNSETSTSNLLSATYDWIIVDQIDDPEITEKDFLDLLGRLRGDTIYQGDDPTMPSTGPRWMIVMCNPTRGWPYRKLVKPLHDYKKGIDNPNLLKGEDGKPIIEIFEGSTYDNAENLPEDFISTLEATYKGQMASRYIKGGWEAYEGLVYPDYNSEIHLIDHAEMESYYWNLFSSGARDNIIEAYDHGIAQPACYLFAFTDHMNNVMILDGFHEKERSVATNCKDIETLRSNYGYGDNEDDFISAEEFKVYADPSIFRRQTGNSRTVGTTTSGLFRENGIRTVPGNNDIMNGIIKVQSYLHVERFHRNPFTKNQGAPRLYISKKLVFIDKEITDYFWKKDTSGEYEDVPTDKNDHAMDAIKYLLTNRPRIANFVITRKKNELPNKLRRWSEQSSNPQSKINTRKHRYG